MKIVWVVNTIMPYPSLKMKLKNNVFGGWLISLLESLKEKKEIDLLAVVATYNGQEIKKFIDGKIIYYLIPCKNNQKYNSQLEDYFKLINKEVKPDLVHLHGTEFPTGLAYMNSCPSNKYIISIQGLVSECGVKSIYNADITAKEIFNSITLRDIIKFDSLYTQYKLFKKRGKYELEMLKRADRIIGRTSWDKSITYKLNKLDKYRFCNESLRPSFYKNSWNYKNIEKHSVFVSQASYPIKGFHKLLKAANILKNRYDDLKIYVAGSNIFETNGIKNNLKQSGYTKYINHLIKMYNLSNNICFTGLLTEEEMIKRMMDCNVFVQASSIENSPNSLGEAMLLGMPVVASYVGGTGDMLKDKEEGLLYPFNDYNMLAYYMSYIFDNNEIAHKMGKNATIKANKTHNIEKNTNCMLEIYKEIVNEINK